MLPPGHTAAAVYIVDPHHGPEADEAALRAVYGLTRAEAHLSAVLLSGRTLEEAAADLFVSLATVRTHLQRIFMKTDTARQSQLLRLLMLGHVLRP